MGERIEWDYKKAGVDIDAAERALQQFSPHCKATLGNLVLASIGPFAGAIDLKMLLESMEMEHPVLLATTDGPGTIGMISKMARGVVTQSFRNIGYAVAAHCFADMACSGGFPFELLDSIASTDVDPDIYEEIVLGMSEACREFTPSVNLIGGEMAQLPGMIVPGQTTFDAFALGLVEYDQMIRPFELIKSGQVMVGVQSLLMLINGLSLYRGIVFDHLGMKFDDIIPATGRTVAEEVLQRPPLYAKVVHELMDAGVPISGVSHITGGGLYDNVVRNLPDNCRAIIDSTTWPKPPLFPWLIEQGNVRLEKAYRTWNMGIGLVLVFPTHEVAVQAINLIRSSLKLDAYLIGQIVEGKRGVEILF